MSNNIRTGIGYDAHPLVSGRRLVLGGVEITYEKGLDGWSDADVLTHAIIDAMLGAAALGDIGSHFPPGEPLYKSVSSMSLLQRTKEKLRLNGWRVSSIDATVVAEEPKLKDYIPEMRRRISRGLKVEIEQVSVKASTANGLGFVGRKEGMEAHAVAVVEKISSS